MHDIKVSVMCTTYNQIEYIEKCLQSLISQETNFQYEVIVHDDASTDGTSEVVRAYAEKYPDLIVPILQVENQYSQHIPIGPTFIHPIARGKYWAFCEGDDFWCDNQKLQRQYDAMELNPQCGLAVHATQCVNKQGVEIERRFPEKDFEEGVLCSQLIIDHLPQWLFQYSSYFVRADLYKKILVQDQVLCQMFPVGDIRYMYMLAAYSDYYYDNRVMSCYRVFSQNSWTSHLSKEKERVFCKKMLNVCHKYCELLKKRTPHLSVASIEKNVITKYEFRIFVLESNYKKMLDKKYKKHFSELKIKYKIKVILKAFLIRDRIKD